MKYSVFLYQGSVILLLLTLPASGITGQTSSSKDDDHAIASLTKEHARVRRGDDDDDPGGHPFDPFHLFRAIFHPPSATETDQSEEVDTVTKLDTYDTHRSNIEMNPYFRIINTIDRDFCAIRMICEVGRPKKKKKIGRFLDGVLKSVLYGDHDRRKRNVDEHKRQKRFFLHKLFQAKEEPETIEEVSAPSTDWKTYKIGSDSSMETSFDFDFHNAYERPGYPYEYYVRGRHGEYSPYSRESRRGYFRKLKNLVRDRYRGRSLEDYGDSAEVVVRGRLGLRGYDDDHHHSRGRPRRLRLGRRRGRKGSISGRQRSYTEVFDEAYDKGVHSNLRICRTLYRECPRPKKTKKKKFLRLRI